MSGALVSVVVPDPVDPTAPTALEIAAIVATTRINTLFDENNARLKLFLVNSLVGMPFDLIKAMDPNGHEKTGK
jgi:hypothetical protein